MRFLLTGVVLVMLGCQAGDGTTSELRTTSDHGADTNNCPVLEGCGGGGGWR